VHGGIGETEVENKQIVRKARTNENIDTLALHSKAKKCD